MGLDEGRSISGFRISDYQMQPWATIYAIPNTLYAILANCPLPLSRTLYKIALFMQNKPNLLDAQMNVSSITTKDYENKQNWTLGENKPNQSQSLAKDLNALVSAWMFISKTVKILVPTAKNEYGLWPDAEIRKKSC